MRILFKNLGLVGAGILAVIWAYAAVAAPLTRPYGPSDYLGGRPAVGPKVNAEFANIVSWLNGGNIASSNVAGFGIITGNIADGAVTKQKLSAADLENVELTSTSITGTTPVAVPGAVTLVSTGRPILVTLNSSHISPVMAAGNGLKITGTSTTLALGNIGFYLDGSALQCVYRLAIQKTVSETLLQSTIPSSLVCMVYNVTAGSHIYSISGSTDGPNSTLQISGSLQAIEL
jgi:hypothetical protein